MNGDEKDRTRLLGVGLCVGVVLVATLFIVALIHGSYWAIAIPTAVIFLGLLGGLFRIGWFMITLKNEEK